jgi:hypothetical protein
MSRVSFGSFRNVVRSGGAPGAGAGPGNFPTTTPVRERAVRCLHRQGLAAAQQALNEGLSGYWSTPGGPSTQARNTRAAFARYVALDRADGRPPAVVELKDDVTFGSHVVGVRVDVVLFEPSGAGYDGRLLLWDTPQLTRDLAELFAAPCVALVDNQLGLPVRQIDLWQLRHRVEVTVDAATARGRYSDVEALLRQSLGP